jgi:hypothetical protein
VNQAADADVVSFRRVSDVHRKRAGQHDERLFLGHVAMAAPLRTRLVTPDVPPRVLEAGNVAQFGNVACRLIRLVRSRDPDKALRIDNAEAHAQRERMMRRSTLPYSSSPSR